MPERHPLVDLISTIKTKEPTKHFSLLLGSGFSRPDGMPSLDFINQRLGSLKETDFYLYQEMSAGFYSNDDYRDPNAQITKNDRRFAEQFISFYINQELKGDYALFNYEVFFDYFIEFLYEKKHETYVGEFCEKYKQEYKISGSFENPRQFLHRFLNIFNQLVASLLINPRYYENCTYTVGYPGYEEFCRAIGIILKDHIVFTHSLNHDLLFDFIGRSVSGLWEYFTDGFSFFYSPYFGELHHTSEVNKEKIHKTNKVRVKQYSGIYENRLRFYKLHGSIDIYPLNLQGSKDQIIVKRDYGVGDIFKESFNKETGKFQYDRPFTNKYPSYLTGTTQKIKRYGDPFYIELFDHFKANLLSSDKLVVIGYGFQDKGINEILEEYYLKKGKQILVIDIAKPACELLERYPKQISLSTKGVTNTSYEAYTEFMAL